MGEIELENIPEIVIYLRKNNTEIRDLAVIAVNSKKKKIVAVGNEGIDYVKEHTECELVVPFAKGKVFDVNYVAMLVRKLIEKNGMKKCLFFHPKISAVVPSKLTAIEKRAYEEVGFILNSKKGIVLQDNIENFRDESTKEYDIAYGLVKNWLDVEEEDRDINSLRIFSNDGDLLVNEPLVLAIDKTTKKAVALGNEALRLKECGRNNLSFILPFAHKKVNDLSYAEVISRYYMTKARNLVKRGVLKQNIVICNVPDNITNVDMRAYQYTFGHNIGCNVTLVPVTFDILKQNVKENINLYVEINN